jgi:hypothetical protein
MPNRRGTPRQEIQETRDALLRAIAGHDANAQLPVVARTRRAIRVANDSRLVRGERGRRQIGITLFVFGTIVVLLAPVIWGAVEDLVGGEHFADLPAQVMLLSAFLMLAVGGALAVAWLGRRGQDEYR